MSRLARNLADRSLKTTNISDGTQSAIVEQEKPSCSGGDHSARRIQTYFPNRLTDPALANYPSDKKHSV